MLESKFCTDDPSDASAKYYPLRFSLRNESIFLDTGLVSDEFFDDTYVNSAGRNRIFFSDLPKHASPSSDEIFDDAYVNSTRRNRVFFSDLPKYASPPGDELFDKTHVNYTGRNRVFFFGIAKMRRSRE